MNDTKRFIASAGTVTVLAVIGFLIWHTAHYSTHAISATRDCLDIFKEKSTEYFDTGKNRFIFNKKMNSCLVLNTVNDPTTGEFRLIVVDMISDVPLFYYDLTTGEEKDSVLGLSKDQALDKVRAYGFLIF